MKKIISSILITVLLVGSLFTLASCGTFVVGTYEGEVDIVVAKYVVTYEFKGNQVTVTSKISSALGSYSSNPISATYKIGEDEDGNKTITFNYGDKEPGEGAAEGGVALPFAQGTEDGVSYIKIAGIKYNKVK